MKKIIFTALVAVISLNSNAQNHYPASGNVGVGTTSPGADIQIHSSNDDARISLTNSGSGSNASSDGFLIINENGNDVHFLNRENTDLKFSTNGSEKFRILNNGNVGIGTSNPSTILEVDGRGVTLNRDSQYGQFISFKRYNTEKWLIHAGLTSNSDDFNIKNKNNSSQFKIYQTGGIIINRDGDNGQYLTFDRNHSQKWQLHAGVGGNDQLSLRNKDNDIVMTVLQSKSIGIGTESTGSHLLAVNGSIGAREIKVEASGWSDFVFENDYNLPSLSDVENYISKNNHLPSVPSESEVMKDGINLGEMDAILLQKIEELTLYTIEQEKKIQALESENNELKELNQRITQIEELLNK